MVKNNTLEFNIETTNAQYEKLLMLKKALLAGENEEVNEQILLDRAREQSLKEIYLIGYLVNTVMNAPKEIKAQNEKLRAYYNNPDKYTKFQKQTEKMLVTNPKFKQYYTKIFSYLDLFNPFNNAVINILIYGICSEIISPIVQLRSDNALLNLHIFQTWLTYQQHIDFSKISILEQKVVLYLAGGYTIKDLLEEQVIIDAEAEKVKTILFEVLPARCNTTSLCQAMAIMFLNNPELNNLNKVIAILENLNNN